MLCYLNLPIALRNLDWVAVLGLSEVYTYQRSYFDCGRLVALADFAGVIVKLSV